MPDNDLIGEEISHVPSDRFVPQDDFMFKRLMKLKFSNCSFSRPP